MIYKSPKMLPEEDLALLVKQYQLGTSPTALSMQFNVDEEPLIKYLRDIPLRQETMALMKKNDSNVKMSIEEIKDKYTKEIAKREKIIAKFEGSVAEILGEKLEEFLQSDFKITNLKDFRLAAGIFMKTMHIEARAPERGRQTNALSFRPARPLQKQGVSEDPNIIDAEVIDLEIIN